MTEPWDGFCTPNDWTSERIWVYLALVDQEGVKDTLRVEDNPTFLTLINDRLTHLVPVVMITGDAIRDTVRMGSVIAFRLITQPRGGRYLQGLLQLSSQGRIALLTNALSEKTLLQFTLLGDRQLVKKRFFARRWRYDKIGPIQLTVWPGVPVDAETKKQLKEITDMEHIRQLEQPYPPAQRPNQNMEKHTKCYFQVRDFDASKNEEALSIHGRRFELPFIPILFQNGPLDKVPNGILPHVYVDVLLRHLESLPDGTVTEETLEHLRQAKAALQQF